MISNYLFNCILNKIVPKICVCSHYSLGCSFIWIGFFLLFKSYFTFHIILSYPRQFIFYTISWINIKYWLQKKYHRHIFQSRDFNLANFWSFLFQYTFLKQSDPIINIIHSGRCFLITEIPISRTIAWVRGGRMQFFLNYTW